MTLLAAPARGINPVAATLTNLDWRNNLWTGADCTAVGVDPAGRVLAFCGDTFTDGNPDPGTGAWTSTHFTNNSLLVWNEGLFGARYSGGTNLFGSPKPWVPGWSGGFRWPAGAVWIDRETDGRLHAIYTGYAGNIFAGYTPAHTVEVTVSADLAATVQTMPGLDPVQVAGKWIEWGKAYVVDGGWAYIFGAIEATTGRLPVVARRAARFGGLGTVTYWDGSGWNASVATVATLTPEVGNVWTVLPHPAGGFLMTGYRLGLLTNEIHLWTATTITGPWTDQGAIFTTPAVFTGQFNYGGVSYLDGRTLRIAWNLNKTGTLTDYRWYGLRWTDYTL